MHKPKAAFTLIELMVVLLISSVLISFAYPAYQRYIVKARRFEAKSSLLLASQRLERYFSNHGSYPTSSGSDGLAAAGIADYSGSSETEAAYRMGYVPVVVSSSAENYILTATLNVAATDTDCAVLAIDATGNRGILDSGAIVSADSCWRN